MKGRHMQITSFKDLYITELQELTSLEGQLVDACSGWRRQRRRLRLVSSRIGFVIGVRRAGIGAPILLSNVRMVIRDCASKGAR
jgi:hypothetical protein